MWSPESRKQRARDLKGLHDKLLRFRQLTDRFSGYFPSDSDQTRTLLGLRTKMEELQTKIADRHRRLAKGVVKIGVVGLEKQGKSAFLSAWLQSERLLPSEAERCTWSTTVVEPGEPGQYRAVVKYYAKASFEQRISSYFDALEVGSVGRWEALDDAELMRLRAVYAQRKGHEVDDPDRASKRDIAAIVELKEISASLRDIKARLGRADEELTASTLDELAEKIRPFIALKDTRNDKPYVGVRAVELVTVMVPVSGAMPGVVLMDLPGIDAPSDKARRDTQEALEDEVDVTIFVKDITRPSLVQQEIELLRTMQSADRSVALRERVFVVLTKIDIFDKPDETGNWHWALAARNFRSEGIERVFPYSKVWAHQGVDAKHPVAKQIQDFFGETRPVNGLDKLQSAVAQYLATDLEAIDRRVIAQFRKEFGEIETQLKGTLITVKDSLNPGEFERRKEAQFDQLWNHVLAGETPRGLLPSMKSRLSAFLDYELSEQQRNARAARASNRIDEIRKDLYDRMTPEEAEALRRQTTSPGLMNETSVEIQMRNRMRERTAAKITGLGEDFRSSARESIERMLQEMFLHASYDGGKLELLLPTGQSMLERIERLGRSGHVSESVLRYQNRELARADVAFEVLARYFARQIIDILDATDERDREIRERELAGLEQFFGLQISDKVNSVAPAMYTSQTPGAGAAGMGSGSVAGVGSGGFPTATPAGFPTGPASFTAKVAAAFGRDGKPAPASEPAKADPPPIPSVGQRDWSRMLNRIRSDVDRICNFLDALARHPRGLQKYHEEAIRTVHDAWFDSEGEQSLRRWARSECTRIWPVRFSALSQEEKRARDDIVALEELFNPAPDVVASEQEDLRR
ncbi:MAG: dynamin family protein [Deltaproteobacteria bacterium]|nr:dynamin family protein [Deltaproteobacteria bacterium]